MPQPPVVIKSLDALADRYSVILCDIWGVMHNGVASFTQATQALERARAGGKIVVLITNSPRPRALVEKQLRLLDVPDESWDLILTSGDVTRNLIRNLPRKLFHIGLDCHLPLYDGLDVELVGELEAAGIVCAGLFNEESETPEDYTSLLQRLRARDLPLICANPDIMVQHGDRLVFCAGALAGAYSSMGGRCLYAGKPHRPIYETALTMAGDILGKIPSIVETLAIGDGILTDVKGAVSMGMDVLFITQGLHGSECGENGRMNPDRLADFLEKHDYWPTASMDRLR